VWAYRRPAEPLRAPRSQQAPKPLTNLSQVGQRRVEIHELPAHELADVGARYTARSPDGDELPDLVEPEAEPLRLSHECEERQDIVPVDAVARCGAAWCGKDPRCLIEAERLPAYAASSGHFTDQETVLFHVPSINPAL